MRIIIFCPNITMKKGLRNLLCTSLYNKVTFHINRYLSFNITNIRWSVGRFTIHISYPIIIIIINQFCKQTFSGVNLPMKRIIVKYYQQSSFYAIIFMMHTRAIANNMVKVLTTYCLCLLLFNSYMHTRNL